jgi:hypothetical protein
MNSLTKSTTLDQNYYVKVQGKALPTSEAFKQPAGVTGTFLSFRFLLLLEFAVMTFVFAHA